MGLSSSKNTSTSSYTPSKQQTQAGDVLNQQFSQQMPKINQYADQIGGLIPGQIDRYRQGDAGVNAARGWITDTLGQQGENPRLQEMIDMAGGDISRQVGAGMGSRGNFGGSVHEKMLANQLSRNSLGMRFDDYNRQQGMKATAAGMAPGVAAGDNSNLAALLSSTQLAGGMPMQAAGQYANGMGGLFGNAGTTTNTQKSSPGLFGILAGLGGAALGGWAGR